MGNWRRAFSIRPLPAIFEQRSISPPSTFEAVGVNDKKQWVAAGNTASGDPTAVEKSVGEADGIRHTASSRASAVTVFPSSRAPSSLSEPSFAIKGPRRSRRI